MKLKDIPGYWFAHYMEIATMWNDLANDEKDERRAKRYRLNALLIKSFDDVPYGC